jgi:leader peptidase (prepilin peptidase)/N-methyltransferase
LVNHAADRLPRRWVDRPPALAVHAPHRARQNRLHRTRYLTVWALALVLGWLASLSREGWTEALILAGVAWFFLAVAVIDLEHRLVLNCMLLPAVPLILLGQWLAGGPQLVSALLGGVTGFAGFLLLAIIRPGSLGMGDVKLAGVVGLAVGMDHLGIALLVGVCAGGLVSLLILMRSGFRAGQTIAYAPYLVVGAWTALYARADLPDLLGKVVR